MTNSFEAIVAVDNITLVANKDTYFPDPLVISFKYTYPVAAPIDRIDPSIFYHDEDEKLELQKSTTVDELYQKLAERYNKNKYVKWL